jgi:hypothetical protein
VRRPPDVVIDRHIDDVFDFLAEITNAPRWATGFISVDQVGGDGPGPGALYDVVRRVRGRPRRVMLACVAFERPQRIAWSEDDRELRFDLQPVWTATRVTAVGGARGDLRALRLLMEGRR